MARALHHQVLVVGRDFPILSFERGLQACGVPDYLCVDTLAAAGMLTGDGFRPSVIVVDAALLQDRPLPAWIADRGIALVTIDSDADDFADTLARRLARALGRQIAPRPSWADYERPSLSSARRPFHGRNSDSRLPAG